MFGSFLSRKSLSLNVDSLPKWSGRHVESSLERGAGFDFQHIVDAVALLIGPQLRGPIKEMSDGAIQRGRLTYSATASAKIALPCGVCEYQSVKRKT
jgi:hypothetical protein